MTRISLWIWVWSYRLEERRQRAVDRADIWAEVTLRLALLVLRRLS